MSGFTCGGCGNAFSRAYACSTHGVYCFDCADDHGGGLSNDLLCPRCREIMGPVEEVVLPKPPPPIQERARVLAEQLVEALRTPPEDAIQEAERERRTVAVVTAYRMIRLDERCDPVVLRGAGDLVAVARTWRYRHEPLPDGVTLRFADGDLAQLVEVRWLPDRVTLEAPREASSMVALDPDGTLPSERLRGALSAFLTAALVPRVRV
jgi:hypothetical protein